MGRPVGHRVLIEVEAPEEVSKGGIILSKDKRHQEAMEIGTVVALGPTAYKGFDDGVPWVQVGDKVLYVRYAGKSFKDNKTEKFYRTINDDEIWFILDEDDDIS